MRKLTFRTGHGGPSRSSARKHPRSSGPDSRNWNEHEATSPGVNPERPPATLTSMCTTTRAGGPATRLRNRVLLAGVALAIAGCGGSSGGGIRPEPPRAPAIVGVVEPAGDHGRQVVRVASHTAGANARVERVVLDPEGNVRDAVTQFVDRYGVDALAALTDEEVGLLFIQPMINEFLAGLPLLETPTPEAFAQRLARYDVTNGSYDINDFPLIVDALGAPRWDNPLWLQALTSQFGYYRTEYPDWWAAATQARVPTHRRTLRVWSAGNERRSFGAGGFGDLALSTHHLKLYSFPEFWGHELIVTALDPQARSIADYANFCGPLPSGWDASRHGRHYCIAAPGHGPNYPSDPGNVGTSFAAPRVAGVLARMHVASRETMRGSHLVKRLMDTADNTGAFADTNIYGAGRLNATRALSPRGALSYASASARSYNATATSVALPSAYGDAGASLAGTEFMAWDEDHFPFWLPAESIVTAGRRTASPIPRITEDSGAAATCPLGASLTGGAACFSSEGSRWSALAGPGGGGVGYALNAWSSVDAYTRTDGRLDGRGSGGLALAGGSSLLGLTAHRAWGGIGGIDALRAETRVTLAVDAPWGAGKAHGAMLDVGTTLLSTAEATLTFAHGGATTSLRLAQPPRAEAGAATLRYPVTRTLDAVPVFEHQSFSLSPSRRELTASVRHERDDVAGGRLAFVASRTEHPGHARTRAEHSLGVAWRMQF